MQEGIGFAEGLTPEEVKVDRFGHGGGFGRLDETAVINLTLPARAIIVAAGTQPNTVLGREDPQQCRARWPVTFRLIDEDGAPGQVRKNRASRMMFTC